MATTAILASTERRNLEQILKESIDRRTARRLRHLEVTRIGDQLTIRAEAASFYIKQLALTCRSEHHGHERVLERRI